MRNPNKSIDYNVKLDIIENTIASVDDLALLHVLQRRLGRDDTKISRTCYWLLTAVVDLHYKPSERDGENAKDCIKTALEQLSEVWK